MTDRLLPVADFFSAQVRRMTRCSVRGHDWQAVEGGQACSRCPMQIRAKPLLPAVQGGAREAEQGKAASRRLSMAGGDAEWPLDVK